ncbi:MAG: autotransporter-associated beta strand repeat-containing protein, partial [Verrucomicrobiales bacterium]
LAPIDLRATGWLDFNDHNETIGNVDAQTALTMRASSLVTTGTGTLTLNGNIAAEAATGATLWTPVVAAEIRGNLNLGSVIRTIDAPDRTELPVDLIISANISGSAGFRKTNAGMLLLTGNNTYSGTTYLESGGITVGTDTALSTGAIEFQNNTALFGQGGTRTLANAMLFQPTNDGNGVILLGNSLVNGSFFGNGGNNLLFTGPANMGVLNGGRTFFHVGVAGNVEFSGGIGDAFGAQSLFKRGYGSMTLSGRNTYSGSTEIETNGGKIILADQGTILNTTTFLIRENAEFIVDNRSGANLDQRLGDLNTINLQGGQLTLIAAASGNSRETIGSIGLVDNRSSSIRSIVAPGADAEWRISSMSGAANGRFVRFIGEGTELGAATGNRIAFTTTPALTDGIINFAVIENRVAGGPNLGFQFASFRDPSATVKPFNNLLEVYTATTASIAGLSGIAGTHSFGTDFSVSSATRNVRLSGSQALTGATLANAVLLANGGIVLSGNTLNIDSGLLISNGTGNSIDATVTTLTLGGVDANLFVVEDGDLTISSNIAGATGSLGKQGTGRLITEGANTFIGQTRINEGFFQARSNGSFGTTAGGVNVNYGATLELANNITVPAETLTLTGNGETWLAAMPLRNVSGTNTWLGGVALASGRTGILIDVGSKLIIGNSANAGVVSGTNGFNKFGGGTLQLAGTGANTFTASTLIWEGTLELNKTAGVNAVALNDNQELFIGNYYGGDNSATLKLLANEQISHANVGTNGGQFRTRIMQTGLFDLNGKTETLLGRTAAAANHDVLGLEIGSAGSANVDLNGGTLRIDNTIATNGRIAVRILNGGVPAAAAMIMDSSVGSTGKLELFGAASAGNRIIDLADSSAVEDLIISATIADGGSVGTLEKQNFGRLVLAPTAVAGNTYSSQTLINRGEVVIRHANALGNATGGTTVNSAADGNLTVNASLIIDGNFTVLNEALRLDTANSTDGNQSLRNGTGFQGQGALRVLSGRTVTWQGNVTLFTNSTANNAPRILINVETGADLVINGAISQTGQTVAGVGLQKVGAGALEFAGGTANTYGIPGTGNSGVTSVANGILRLNKSAGVAAVQGRLEAGDNNGAAGTAIVRWMADNQFADQPNISNALLGAETDGLLDLNGFSETIVGPAANALYLRMGTTTSGDIDLKGGTLTLGDGITNGSGNIGVLNLTTLIITSPASRIMNSVPATGSVIVAGSTTNLNGAWDVADTIRARELEVSAKVGFTGTGRIRKTNGGLLALTADNSATYVGGTIELAGGVVAAANSNALGSATTVLNVTASSALSGLPGGAATTIAQDITLTNTLTLRGDTDLTLSGEITNSAGNRTLAFNMNEGVTASLTGTINLSNDTANRILNLTNNTFNDVAEVSALIQNGGGSSAGGLTTSGNGVTRLSGSNTYGGLTTVNGGFLRVGSADALGGVVSEVQTFAITAGAAGSFTIQFNGATTAAIPTDTGTGFATAAAVKAALDALPYTALLGGDITVGAANVGNITTYTVTFGGPLAGADVAALVVTPTTVTLSTAVTETVKGSGTTTVNSGFTLEIEPGLTLSEPLTLNGVGFNSYGALRVLDGGSNQTTTLTGNIALAGTSWINVARAGDSLDLGGDAGGQVISGAGGITTFGPGTVILNGVNSNLYTGTTTVNNGTLLLSKTFSGSNATAATSIFALGTGAVIVGDGGGLPGGDILRWDTTAAGSGAQILPNVSITVGSTGWLDLATNNRSASIGNLILTTGVESSAMASSGTGTLRVNGDVTVSTFGATDDATPAAMLSGDVLVNGTFTVNDTLVASTNADLVVSGTLDRLVPDVNGYVAGLSVHRLGALAGALPAVGTWGVQLTPFDAESNTIPSNTNTVYYGQFFHPDGVFSFAENFDDNVQVIIDGQVRILNNSGTNPHSTPTSTANTGNFNTAPAGNVTANIGMGPLGDGWHDIELRFFNSAGGGGAGWPNSVGFGLSAIGASTFNSQDYTVPFDDGSGTVFRTLASSTSFALTKAGAGTLDLQAVASHTGATTVTNGILALSGADGALAASTAVTVNPGATLLLDNSSAVNPAVGGRIADTANVTLTGGTLVQQGHASTAVNEVIHSLTINAAANNLGGGSSVIRSVHNGGDLTLSTLAATGLVRGCGATV